MKIAVLVTGGTFDKEYNELDGTLFFKDTHLEEMLTKARCGLSVRVEVLMMKDSLEFTDDDHRKIVETCLSCEESQIVITHGTDTMEQTAKILADVIKDKTVVLTGAMIPYAFGSSDGLFNLGSALSFAQVLPLGVFIAMNGRYFDAHNVFKDRERGIFRPKESE